MPYVETDDSVKLYYQDTGSGAPVIFVHEFAGDLRSWEPQVGCLARRYRCVTYNARGYPPSDVPDDPAHYSQARARDDIAAVLDHLGIERAHVVGLSMGGFATLHFGLAYPQRARSLVVAGCGYGAEAARRDQFRTETDAVAARFENEGSEAVATSYAVGPTRVQFQNKDPLGWQRFADLLAGHSARGAALTMRGVQKERPSLWQLEAAMRRLTVPTLIMTGDEDDPCLAPGIFMKQTIPTAGLVVLPKSGHTINLEEPEAFNRALADFFAQVDAGRWESRDPRSVTASIMG